MDYTKYSNQPMNDNVKWGIIIVTGVLLFFGIIGFFTVETNKSLKEQQKNEIEQAKVACNGYLESFGYNSFTKEPEFTCKYLKYDQ